MEDRYIVLYRKIKPVPLSVLDEVIKNVVGSSVNEESFQAWKGDNHFSGKKFLFETLVSSYLSNEYLKLLGFAD